MKFSESILFCNQILSVTKCAEECAEDSNCKAFSFLDTNILGHAEYTCNLMGSLTCSYGALNQNDPRSSFHVKGLG